MKTVPNNPASNKLSSGLNERGVLTAISKSGYPLQTIVANSLRPQFRIQEEWCYIDQGTQEPRTIDILAEKLLFEFTDERQPRIRPTLDLIIECKQSELPYVFFLSSSRYFIPHFPLLAGLFKNNIKITTDDDASSWNLLILRALELHSHPFLAEESALCTTFSKCVRSGSGIELSGSKPFHELALPLLKAMSHFQMVQSPPETAYYFDLNLVVGVAILDAPMIGVHVSEESHALILLPWVRFVRHEPQAIPGLGHKTRLFAIDIIHKDFIQKYLTTYLLPFARDFSKLAIKHQEVLADGRAFVTGMGKDSWHDIEKRLEPAKMIARVSRSKIIGRNILRLLTGRKPVDGQSQK